MLTQLKLCYKNDEKFKSANIETAVNVIIYFLF
jgi:hypothetical protein